MEFGNLHSTFFIFTLSYLLQFLPVSSDLAVMHFIIGNVDIATIISG